MSFEKLKEQITSLSAEDLADFQQWFWDLYGRAEDHFDYRSEVPKHLQVLVCLDALWNSPFIRREYEIKAVNKAGRIRIGTIYERLPPRPDMWEVKQGFESDFYGAISDAIEKLDLLRAGTALEEIFQPNARVVYLGKNKYGVEIWVKRDAEPFLIGGFEDPDRARRWIRNSADEFAVEKGAAPGTKLLTIG